MLGPKFQDLKGHVLVMVQALNRTRSRGAHWHHKTFGILIEMVLLPSSMLGPKFKELKGHVLAMVQALNRTRSRGAHWHHKTFDILTEMVLLPSRADPDVLWTRPSEDGQIHEYIAIYVDDLAIATRDPGELCKDPQAESQSKGRWSI